MFSKFKKGTKVIVYGFGKCEGQFYENALAFVIERDPYFHDYHVIFENGTEDWFSGKYLRTS